MTVRGSLQRPSGSAAAPGKKGGDPVEAVPAVRVDAAQGSEKDHVPVPVAGLRAGFVDLSHYFGDLFRKAARDDDVVFQDEPVGFGTLRGFFPDLSMRKKTADDSRRANHPGD
mmetsp:Transcript_24960/g.58918  ORF Transcript_24960/g.58918 Transcript_24960/m.58918 type:complete len:113 (-) Transcript_24960:463-801(-)